MSMETRIDTPRGSVAEPTAQLRSIPPRTDVYENDTEVLVVADMPGVEVGGVNLRFEKNELRITGTPNAALFGQEEPAFAFERRFVVPTTIDGEGITAEIDKGTLSVHLPKSKAAQPRQIPVRSA